MSKLLDLIEQNAIKQSRSKTMSSSSSSSSGGVQKLYDFRFGEEE